MTAGRGSDDALQAKRWPASESAPLLPLLLARTGENISQRVVALVAGVSKRGSRIRVSGIIALHGMVYRRIGDRELVLDRLGVDSREAFHQPRVRGGALQARLAPEVDRFDDQCLAVPRPRESPDHWRSVVCGRPSVGMTRALCTISLTMTTTPGDCTISTLLLYTPGVIGGPELNPWRHRSARGRSAYESPRPESESCRMSATLRRAASVSGILPSGGSKMSDVRLSRVSLLPRWYQNSLYNSTPPWERGA